MPHLQTDLADDIMHASHTPYAGRVVKGHRIVSHTPAVGVEAWGPNRESCIGEAVLGVAQAFGGSVSQRRTRVWESWVPSGSDTHLLVNVIDEVVYLLESGSEVPVEVAMEPRGNGVVIRFMMAAADGDPGVGGVAKGVSLHGLRIGSEVGVWSCSVVVEV